MSLKNSKQQQESECKNEDCVMLVFQRQNNKEKDPSQQATTEASVKKHSTAEDPAAEVLTLQLHLCHLVQLQCGMHKMQLLAQNLDKRQF